MNNNSSKAFVNRLARIIDLVRKPAGETFNHKKIIEDPDSFMKAFHDGYKKLHYLIIADIMRFESLRERYVKYKSQFSPYLKDIMDETILIWRRINDAIAWIMLSLDSYRIRRLHLGNPRGSLKDQNPEYVLDILEKLNSEPMYLAIWNDATSCIDIGDILFCDKKRNVVASIELKGGIVNEIIDHILKYGCEREMYFFLKKYGEKGSKQFKRTAKQHIKYGQILKFLKEEKGYDPATDQEIRIIEVETPDEVYHEKIDALINNAREKCFDITLIDNCLWLFAFDQTKLSRSYAIRQFSKLVLSQDSGQLKKWLSDFSPKINSLRLYPIHDLKTGLKVPESLPIFLFKISSSNVLDILLDRIVVLMFIDWNEFKNLLMNKGICLIWSSKKEGRKERSMPPLKRSLVIGGRIPMLKTKKSEIKMGAKGIFRIYYDGIRPRCIIDQYYEAFAKN